MKVIFEFYAEKYPQHAVFDTRKNLDGGTSPPLVPGPEGEFFRKTPEELVIVVTRTVKHLVVNANEAKRALEWATCTSANVRRKRAGKFGEFNDGTSRKSP